MTGEGHRRPDEGRLGENNLERGEGRGQELNHG
jgi:hypothetical protein